jgi:ABC-type transport system substrate-binding protein
VPAFFRSLRRERDYHNADFDGMIDEAQTAMDPKRRLELYHRINRLWVDDGAAMPLYQQVDLYGGTKRITWRVRGDEAIKGYDIAVKDGK